MKAKVKKGPSRWADAGIDLPVRMITAARMRAKSLGLDPGIDTYVRMLIERDLASVKVKNEAWRHCSLTSGDRQTLIHVRFPDESEGTFFVHRVLSWPAYEVTGVDGKTYAIDQLVENYRATEEQQKDFWSKFEPASGHTLSGMAQTIRKKGLKSVKRVGEPGWDKPSKSAA